MGVTGLIEFNHIDTGESFCVPAHSIRYVRSRDTFRKGILDYQVTSVGFADIELDVEGTYDEVCFALKEAGYDIKMRMQYHNVRKQNNGSSEELP